MFPSMIMSIYMGQIVPYDIYFCLQSYPRFIANDIPKRNMQKSVACYILTITEVEVEVN